VISVDQVRKSFGHRVVLDGFDLEVRPGAVSLLVGANGAGKSTSLRILSGLLQPDGGRVRLNAIDLRAHRSAALSQLSFLPQSPNFHPRLTTRQVASYYGQLRRRTDNDVMQELAAWQLLDHAHVVTGHLSGGMRQRLALAIFALARAPILLLDEPGLSLDPFWRARLQTFLMDEARAGRTVLVATHLLGEWEGRVDTCFALKGGRVAGELPAHRLREAFAAQERAPLPVSETSE
jgi:ABC-2 type transport system ATP-binding protein